MAHNTFTITTDAEWTYAQSHNFPEFIGRGRNEQQALNMLNTLIGEYIQHNRLEFLRRTEDRLRRGLWCECGESLGGPVIGILGT